MDLLKFKEKLAESLIHSGQFIITPVRKKRGRPSTSSNTPSPSLQELPPPKRRRIDQLPEKTDIKDCYDHFPLYDEKPHPLFCKRSGCKLKSHWMCEKCKVHLCITSRNNCFYLYHKDN